MKTCIFTLLFVCQTHAFAEDTMMPADTETQVKGQHTIIYSKKLRKHVEEVDESIVVLDKIVVRPEQMPDTPEVIQEEIAQAKTQDDQ